MLRIPFNADWYVRRQTSPFLEIMGQAEPPLPVTLPHDWLIAQPRSADHQPGALTAYYGEGVVEYLKTFAAPEGFRDGRVELAFDGVYRGAMVYVNDSFVGQRPYGYVPFAVRIDRQLREGDNEIRVECRNHLDARWYSGLGIYRDVSLLVGGAVHVARNGVHVRTITADEEGAVIDVVTTLESDATDLRAVRVVTELADATGAVVATESAQLRLRPLQQTRLRQRFSVARPRRWDVDEPHLHVCRVRVEDKGGLLEEAETRFGIRTLEWDARRGLRLNGRALKLRGGCVHHDNGLIGAATIARAEERRVELLKLAGYNAIRSAHNPVSEAMLDACDRLGMLVMDEFTDGWTTSGLGFGYGVDLAEWWRRDLTEMVYRDRNHPSVIMYSIGNEVADTGNAWDALRGRDMVDLLKELDDTRPVTNGLNPMMTMLHDMKAQIGRPSESSGVNTLMRDVGEMMHDLLASDLVTERLEEAMSQLDVVGYNYSSARYELDISRHPQRLLVGTEGTPGKLDEVWPLVERHPQVLGEFGWTAWEYLGEAGLGADKPAEEGFFGSYPWRLSMTADLGITGERRTISYWRETVWGLRTTPYVAVHRPLAEDRPELTPSFYTWSDSVSSWSFPGHEGSPITVEVYSDAEEVELLLNDAVVGRAPAGPQRRFMALFETTYQPGELVAVAYREGIETGRYALRSAGQQVRVVARPDRTRLRADHSDLAFLDIGLEDEHGVGHVTRDTEVTVSVIGCGVLQGLGSTDPASEQDYTAASCRTHLGRALAVVRPTGPGTMTVRVEAATLPAVETVLHVG